MKQVIIVIPPGEPCMVGIFCSERRLIQPIPNEGDKYNLSTYGPVMDQSQSYQFLAKGFEKVAYKQLYDYFGNYSVLLEQLYGFRAKKFTTQVILHSLK